MAAITGDPGVIDVVAAVAAIISLYQIHRVNNVNEEYYEDYKEQREFYFNNYAVGAETPFAAEVFGEPLYTRDMPGAYASLRDDMLAYLDPFEGWYERKMRMYHMPNFLNTVTHTPQTLDRTAHQDDWGNYVAAREQHFKDVYDGRRFSRQLDSLNVAIKQATSIERGLASSFAVLDEAYGNTAGFFASLSNGLGQMSGYFDAARERKLGQVSEPSVTASRAGDSTGIILSPSVRADYAMGIE